MNNTSAPVFGKSMRGYKKEDVNTYILMLSRRLEDAERGYAALSEQNADMLAHIRSLEAAADKVPSLLAEVERLEKQLGECTALLEAEKSTNSELQLKADDAEVRAEKAEAEYSKICRSAGQIFALAGNTADDILRRADAEAHRIVDDAHNTKNTVFQSISETTEGFTSELSNYIKSAISDCIERINEAAGPYAPKDDPDMKVRFLKDN